MHSLEQNLRATGDPVDIERANIIAAMLISRGEDIPLPPNNESRVTTISNVGNLVLRSGDSIDKPVLLKDEQTKGASADLASEIATKDTKLEILSAAEEITRPYVDIFLAIAPNLGTGIINQPPSHKLLRKNKSDDKTSVKATDTHNWTTRELTDSAQLSYGYAMDYQEVDGVTKLRQVVLTINSPHDRYPGHSMWPSTTQLGIYFDDDNRISELGLYLTGHKTPDTLLKATGDSTLRHAYDTFMVKETEYSDWTRIRFKLMDDDPRLYLEQYSRGKKEEGAISDELSSTFRLIAGSNEFKRFIGNTSAHKAYSELRGISLIETISQDYYLDLLRSMMALIPTLTDNELQSSHQN